MRRRIFCAEMGLERAAPVRRLVQKVSGGMFLGRGRVLKTIPKERGSNDVKISSTVPDWNGAAVIIWLLNLGDYQVRGNWPGSACQRRDRQRRSGSCGISHSQNGVDNCCFHNCHSDNLGCSCCAACDCICQICAIQGKNQLAGFGHAHLEQYLIGADFCQIEGTGAGSGNAGSAVGSILRETDIRPRCNRCRVVGRH